MKNFGKAMMVAGYAGAYHTIGSTNGDPRFALDMPAGYLEPARCSWGSGPIDFDEWCRRVHAFAAKHIADQYGYEVEAA